MKGILFLQLSCYCDLTEKKRVSYVSKKAKGRTSSAIFFVKSKREINTWLRIFFKMIDKTYVLQGYHC